MDNKYAVIVRGLCEFYNDYVEIGFCVFTPGALDAVREAFDLAGSFGLTDKTLLLLELVEEDV